MNSRFFLVAMIAASLQRLAMSAPLNPGDNSESLLAMVLISTPGSIFRGAKWTIKIYSLAFTSGKLISTIRSNLPGLVNALSRISFRLVAAKTMIVSLLENPSISTSNWFNVVSFYSFLEFYLFLPMASISSMKIIEGAFCLALANKSLTFEAPRPTKTSTNSEPEM